MPTAALRKLPARPSHTVSKPRAPKAKRSAAPSRSGPFARIVVDVPESTHRQLKATAAMEGKSIRDYVLELLAEQGVVG